jgi:hypothetical protein
MEEGEEKTREVLNEEGERVIKVVRKGIKRRDGTGCSSHGTCGLAADVAVEGEVFQRWRGKAAGAADVLWSARDLRQGIE